MRRVIKIIRNKPLIVVSPMVVITSPSTNAGRTRGHLSATPQGNTVSEREGISYEEARAR